jgi:hypothetical protein
VCEQPPPGASNGTARGAKGSSKRSSGAQQPGAAATHRRGLGRNGWVKGDLDVAEGRLQHDSLVRQRRLRCRRLILRRRRVGGGEQKENERQPAHPSALRLRQRAAAAAAGAGSCVGGRRTAAGGGGGRSPDSRNRNANQLKGAHAGKNSARAHANEAARGARRAGALCSH